MDYLKTIWRRTKMTPQTIQEQDLDYCSKCDAVMRFNKCSNGCHDKQQYQILKTYKSLKSAFRNWKRSKGEQIGNIEEYHDFIIELQDEVDKDLPNNKLIVLYSYNGKGFTDFYPFKNQSIHPTKLSTSLWKVKNKIDLGKVD